MSWECQKSIQLFIIDSMSPIVDAEDTAVRFTVRMPEQERSVEFIQTTSSFHRGTHHTKAWGNGHTGCFLNFEEGKVGIVYIFY